MRSTSSLLRWYRKGLFNEEIAESFQRSLTLPVTPLSGLHWQSFSSLAIHVNSSASLTGESIFLSAHTLIAISYSTASPFASSNVSSSAPPLCVLISGSRWSLIRVAACCCNEILFRDSLTRSQVDEIYS